jgi:hypothetical protein
MILEKPEVQPEEFARRTGWIIKPEGACKGEVCVSLPAVSRPALDVTMLAERLRMPLVRDEAHGLWCLGPEAGGKVLATARAPELSLPEWRGGVFNLHSLHGTKVLLLAWASW